MDMDFTSEDTQDDDGLEAPQPLKLEEEKGRVSQPCDVLNTEEETILTTQEEEDLVWTLPECIDTDGGLAKEDSLADTEEVDGQSLAKEAAEPAETFLITEEGNVDSEPGVERQNVVASRLEEEQERPDILLTGHADLEQEPCSATVKSLKTEEQHLGRVRAENYNVDDEETVAKFTCHEEKEVPVSVVLNGPHEREPLGDYSNHFGLIVKANQAIHSEEFQTFTEGWQSENIQLCDSLTDETTVEPLACELVNQTSNSEQIAEVLQQPELWVLTEICQEQPEQNKQAEKTYCLEPPEQRKHCEETTEHSVEPQDYDTVHLENTEPPEQFQTTNCVELLNRTQYSKEYPNESTEPDLLDQSQHTEQREQPEKQKQSEKSPQTEKKEQLEQPEKDKQTNLPQQLEKEETTEQLQQLGKEDLTEHSQQPEKEELTEHLDPSEKEDLTEQSQQSKKEEQPEESQPQPEESQSLKEESTEQLQQSLKEESTEQLQQSEKEESTEQSQQSLKEESTEQLQQSEKEESTEQLQQSEKEDLTEHSQQSEKEEQPEEKELPEKEESTEQSQQSEEEKQTEQSQQSEEEKQTEESQQSETEEQPEELQHSEKAQSTEQSQQSEKEESTEQLQLLQTEDLTEHSQQSKKEKQPEESQPSEKEESTEKSEPEREGQSEQSKRSEHITLMEHTGVTEQPVQMEGSEQSDQFLRTPSTTAGLQAETSRTVEMNQAENKSPDTEVTDYVARTEFTQQERQSENSTQTMQGAPVQTGLSNGGPPGTLENKTVVDREKASCLAERLYRLDGIQHKDVVRHLDKDNDFSRAVGEEYLKFFDFTGQTLDDSLRSFLKVVLLIGETQERERVLQHFACRFHQCNPHSLPNAETVLTLTCALMLLNSDLHGQNVGKSMSASDFVSNLNEMDEGQNFSKELLKNLYSSIKNEPLEWAVDEEELKSSMLLEDDAKEDAPVRCKSNPFQDVPHDSKAKVFKQGFLQRKTHADIDGKRTPWGKRSWKTFYGVLRGMVLYLHKDEYKKEYESTEEVVSVHHALAERAINYTKKPHVFRLQTADWRVFLFQASSRAEMSSWINRINLASALHSSPPFPAAVGSQRRFCRPILPASQSAHTLDRQLQSHAGMLESFQNDLTFLRQNLPEGKRAKAKELEEQRVREDYLQHEICRYEAYIRALEAWKGLNMAADAVVGTKELTLFDKALCKDILGDEAEEVGLKKSHSSPSLDLEMAPPPLVKVKRNISERRTYRKTIITRRHKIQ